MIDIKKEEKSGTFKMLFIKSELYFYTDYGYVKVLKSEYESPSQLLNCYKDEKKLQASIKVISIIINYREIV